MEYYPSLQELLAHSPNSIELYRTFSPEHKAIIQAHMQSIHTYADLQKIAVLFDADSRRK